MGRSTVNDVFIRGGVVDGVIKRVVIARERDQPAIDLNKSTMAKYRDQMKKYYYDPTKYKTYLEQLGIQYPTIRK